MLSGQVVKVMMSSQSSKGRSETASQKQVTAVGCDRDTDHSLHLVSCTNHQHWLLLTMKTTTRPGTPTDMASTYMLCIMQYFASSIPFVYSPECKTTLIGRQSSLFCNTCFWKKTEKHFIRLVLSGKCSPEIQAL